MAEKSIVECRKPGCSFVCVSVVIKSIAIGVCRCHFSLSRVGVGVVVTHLRRKIKAQGGIECESIKSVMNSFDELNAMLNAQ